MNHKHTCDKHTQKYMRQSYLVKTLALKTTPGDSEVDKGDPTAQIWGKLHLSVSEQAHFMVLLLQ